MEAIIFIGVQAAGKSTFYKNYFFKTHVRINLDMLKTRNREHILIEACIKGKQAFVVDNTNATILERKKYIDAAKLEGFKVIGYYFHSSISDAIRRNEKRIGKECVPLAGITNTYKKLQLPKMDEGFDKLYFVSLNEYNEFIVEEWKDEV